MEIGLFALQSQQTSQSAPTGIAFAPLLAQGLVLSRTLLPHGTVLNSVRTSKLLISLRPSARQDDVRAAPRIRDDRVSLDVGSPLRELVIGPVAFGAEALVRCLALRSRLFSAGLHPVLACILEAGTSRHRCVSNGGMPVPRDSAPKHKRPVAPVVYDPARSRTTTGISRVVRFTYSS